MNLYLDIETVPTQLGWVRDDLSSSIKPPGTLKLEKSIAAWEAESKPAAIDEAIDKTSFDGGLGQCVVIGWAIDDAPPQSVQVADLTRSEEAKMLSAVFTYWRAASSGTSGTRPTIIGHNVAAFDIPFLWKRAMVLGIKPPLWFTRDPKPWGDAVFDTMSQWAGVRERVSLDRLCKILDIPGKGDGPTGADVWPMVQAGKMDEVATYCRADVERTRAIHRRMVFA